MRYQALLLALSALFVFGGCTNKFQSSGSTVIASVDNEQLLLEDALEKIPAAVLEQDTASAVQTYAEQWVRSQVSIQHAERVGVHQSPEFQRKMDRFYDQLLESQLKEFILEENQDEIEVTQEEAQNYYQAHKDRFLLDEKYVRFRHLTTRTRTEADNANRELAEGVEWEQVVQKYSVDPDLQLRRSAMYWPASMAAADIPALNQYLDIMGITERSPIHFYGGRYHLVQLMDIKSEGESPELEWLLPQIREWLVLEKSKRIVNAYIRNLYLQADANNEIELSNVSDIQTILSEQYRNQ